MSNDIFPEFTRNLAEMSVTPQERTLIAVSGGPDSMALLHLFLRWNTRKIGVFHLNHGFRDNASEDARFVERYAGKMNIPVEIQEYDINRYLAISGESKQQGARKIRYRLLRNFAELHGYHWIALGHHGDDQAETVLMRILRGSGLHGLGGIPTRRGMFIRPLLNIHKEDILRYCQDFGIPYVHDETNFQPIYMRNKVREELLPLLAKEYNPEIVPQLMQLAELAREDELELQSRAEEICKEHMKWRAGQVIFPRGVFTQLSTAMQRRVLRELLRLYRGDLLQIGFVHIEEWRMQLLDNTAFRLSLPQVSVSANVNCIFVGSLTEKKWESMALNVPGEISVGGFTIRAELHDRASVGPRPENSEDFDLDALTLPLRVRPRQKGDRMRPFGWTGTKKVKDLLIDAHIPLEQRDFLPLICDKQGILWIPNVRRSERGAILASTNRVLRLIVVKAS